jgi:hypothetical protein
LELTGSGTTSSSSCRRTILHHKQDGNESVIVMDEVLCRKIRKTPITNKQAASLGVAACGCHHMLYWKFYILGWIWSNARFLWSRQPREYYEQGSCQKRAAGFPWHFIISVGRFTILGVESSKTTNGHDVIIMNLPQIKGLHYPNAVLVS